MPARRHSARFHARIALASAVSALQSVTVPHQHFADQQKSSRDGIAGELFAVRRRRSEFAVRQEEPTSPCRRAPTLSCQCPVRAARTVGHSLPVRVTPSPTSGKPRPDAGEKVGAGDRDRTGDIQLGKIEVVAGDDWGSLGTGLRKGIPVRTQLSPGVPKQRREQSANSQAREITSPRLLERTTAPASPAMPRISDPCEGNRSRETR